MPFLIKGKTKKIVKLVYLGKNEGDFSGKINGKVICGENNCYNIFIKFKGKVLKSPLKFSSLNIQFKLTQEGEKWH